MPTTLAETRQPFRLGQLLYDTRYRSVTLQIIALSLIAATFFVLTNNTVQNLSALGKDIDFGFLSGKAGYDINQTLIPYDSTMSHARAALTGIVNTILVAVLGCILATIIGVFAGVLRLSNNWIVARLSTVYIEGFRNIPLLLWILLIFALMSESMPKPREFNPGGGAEMALFDSVAITNRGIFVPRPILENGSLVLLITLFASLVTAFIYWQWATRRLYKTGHFLPRLWPSVLIAIVPSIIMFFLLGRPVSLELPELSGFNFQGGINIRNSLIALWFALSLYTGAFIAEIVRGGILSVDRGQSEAAFALGLSAGRVMSLVILPQALRVIFPPLISQFLNLTKNSSLAIAVGYMDVRATLGGITINQTGRELEGMLLLGVFYLSLSLIISFGMNTYNKRNQLVGR